MIEALVAAFVVGVGMLSFAKLQSGFIQDYAESRVHTAALHLAQQKLESLRGFSSTAEATSLLGAQGSALTGEDRCDPETESSDCAGINTTLNRQWQISDCPNAVPCRQVAVTVSWTDSRGSKQTQRLTAFITPVDPIATGLAIAD